MTDQELADKVVALGIGEHVEYGGVPDIRYAVVVGNDTFSGYYASEFVRDWRVAGTCLERWPTTINVEHLDMTLDKMLRDPRAITEAYVEALSND